MRKELEAQASLLTKLVSAFRVGATEVDEAEFAAAYAELPGHLRKWDFVRFRACQAYVQCVLSWDEYEDVVKPALEEAFGAAEPKGKGPERVFLPAAITPFEMRRDVTAARQDWRGVADRFIGRWLPEPGWKGQIVAPSRKVGDVWALQIKVQWSMRRIFGEDLVGVETRQDVSRFSMGQRVKFTGRVREVRRGTNPNIVSVVVDEADVSEVAF